MLGSAPFVLLDDARPGGAAARLYRDPVRVLEAAGPAEVANLLTALRAAGGTLHAVGYLAYEAGAAFEPKGGTIAGATPVAWFGLFRDYLEVPTGGVTALLPDPRGAWIGPPEPAIDRATYDAQFARVLDLIAAGDLYQANLSFAVHAPLIGDPLALYARMREGAGAGWSAIVATGTRTILSFSPELFFALEGETLACRPMKGTARRGDTPEADRAEIEALGSDAKQRAENLMIVDLMRNDLSRVATPGSVAVDTLFAVETYPTVHQMVSHVSARLQRGRDACDVLAALFPCGSITGAPKVRAMQAIGAIETRPRGVYTGAIGRIDADGDAMFNVAIRTLTIEAGAATAVLGLGSGIVADSRADDEWDECLAKGAFVTRGQRDYDFIETMAFDPLHGIALLDLHLARMKTSADAFGIAFDRHHARNELQAATFRLRTARRIRLLLGASGAIAIEVSAMPDPVTGPVAVAILPLPVAETDVRLANKTTDRAFYDTARRTAGRFEVLFERGDGRLTEGSFTSLFVARGDGLVTPYADGALLPGVLRADLIANGRAVEGDVRRADLADGFFIGNALRGLVPAVLAQAAPPPL